jgi:hypothetical protein
MRDRVADDRGFVGSGMMSNLCRSYAVSMFAIIVLPWAFT